MMFNDAERDNEENRRKKGKYLALVLLLKLMNIDISISTEVKYLNKLVNIFPISKVFLFTHKQKINQ